MFLASEIALSRRLVVVKIGWFGTSEAEIIAKLQHPYIVQIHSVSADPLSGLTLICMPYRGRTTLAELAPPLAGAQHNRRRPQSVPHLVCRMTLSSSQKRAMQVLD